MSRLHSIYPTTSQCYQSPATLTYFIVLTFPHCSTTTKGTQPRSAIPVRAEANLMRVSPLFCIRYNHWRHVSWATLVRRFGRSSPPVEALHTRNILFSGDIRHLLTHWTHEPIVCVRMSSSAPYGGHRLVAIGTLLPIHKRSPPSSNESCNSVNQMGCGGNIR